MQVRPYRPEDIPAMTAIWNQVVRGGVAFPQEEELTEATAPDFFGSQSHCGVVEEVGKVVGLYILHPNNVGRCGHLSNASYAVEQSCQSRGIGRALVTDCMTEARKLGFRVLQFNAVVATNAAARHLYESLGFTQLGTIPGGFRMDDGSYADICPYYITL